MPCYILLNLKTTRHVYHKQGLVTHILKGDNKSNTSPDTYMYRHASRLWCMLKLFERDVQNRLHTFILSVDKFPNHHQQGYQKHLKSLTTYLCLLETVYITILN